MGCLADYWGFAARAVDYAAVGGGSYHWVVAERDGRRAFVTVDDLDTKPWLEGRRESVLDGLRRAYDTAVALRDSGGLDCVVAPIPTKAGETVVPSAPGTPSRCSRSSPDRRVAMATTRASIG